MRKRLGTLERGLTQVTLIQGYIKFKRGLGGFGQCSITHEPAYAIKTSPNPVLLTPLSQAGRKGGAQLEAGVASS